MFKNPQLLLGLLLAAIAPQLMAQSAPASLKVNPRDLPRMYVGAITLDKAQYAPGDTIKGSFPLSSYGANETGNLKCVVSLVSLDKGGHVARMIYDQVRFGPFDITSPGTKKIKFEYPITFVPKDDKLAIHVRVVTQDGKSLSWAVKKVAISGGVAMMEPQKGFVEVNSKDKHRLQFGPTLKSSDTISFVLSLKNPSGEIVRLIPSLSLTDKAGISVAAPIFEDPLTIAAGETAKVRLELPVKGLKPNTYLAVITFKDDKGIQRAPHFYARYIIGGDMVGVDQVLSDAKTPLTKETPVNISIGYAGKPLAINHGIRAGIKDYAPVVADISVKLFDENKKPVGEAALKNQKLGLSGFIGLLVPTKPAKELSAQVTVNEGETILCSYEGKVIYDAGCVAHKPASKPAVPAKVASAQKPAPAAKTNIVLIGAVAAVFLLAIVILVVAGKAKRHHNLLLIAVGAGLLTFLGGVSNALGQSIVPTPDYSNEEIGLTYAGGKHGSAPGNFTVTKSVYDWATDRTDNTMLYDLSGGPTSAYYGQSFDVNISFEAVSCRNQGICYQAVTNSPASSNANPPGVVQSNTVGDQIADYIGPDDGSWDYNNVADVYLGTFTAPTYADVSGASAFQVGLSLATFFDGGDTSYESDFTDSTSSTGYAGLAGELKGYWTVDLTQDSQNLTITASGTNVNQLPPPPPPGYQVPSTIYVSVPSGSPLTLTASGSSTGYYWNSLPAGFTLTGGSLSSSVITVQTPALANFSTSSTVPFTVNAPSSSQYFSASATANVNCSGGTGAVYSTPQIKIAATASPTAAYSKWFKATAATPVTVSLPQVTTLVSAAQPPPTPTITQTATVYVGDYHSSYYGTPGTLDVAVLVAYDPYQQWSPIDSCTLTVSGPGVTDRDDDSWQQWQYDFPFTTPTASCTLSTHYYNAGNLDGEEYGHGLPAGNYAIFQAPIWSDNAGQYTFTATPSGYAVINGVMTNCNVNTKTTTRYMDIPSDEDDW
jgi:hypothetical protein